MTLDLSDFSSNIVYGLKENSLSLYLDEIKATDATGIEEFETFCYFEVKLMPKIDAKKVDAEKVDAKKVDDQEKFTNKL